MIKSIIVLSFTTLFFSQALAGLPTGKEQQAIKGQEIHAGIPDPLLNCIKLQLGPAYIHILDMRSTKEQPHSFAAQRFYMAYSACGGPKVKVGQLNNQPLVESEELEFAEAEEITSAQ